MNKYDYILDRIASADFSDEPFRHIYIENFFAPQDFAAIVGSPEVDVRRAASDEDLVEELRRLNFKEIPFPGTTTDVNTYLEWHKDRGKQNGVNNKNCEGFGVTFRLQSTRADSALREVDAFFKSSGFWNALAAKFGLEMADCRSDYGLQKYLDGYEISPHPDIRRKALTWMLNINPASDSDALDIHTHYMRFKPEHRHVQEGWSERKHIDRNWVPWNWCETVKRQTRNNSIVIFSPSDDTLHAVKANYDHLLTQRTQYYGNLWYKQNPTQSSAAEIGPGPRS